MDHTHVTWVTHTSHGEHTRHMKAIGNRMMATGQAFAIRIPLNSLNSILKGERERGEGER